MGFIEKGGKKKKNQTRTKEMNTELEHDPRKLFLGMLLPINLNRNIPFHGYADFLRSSIPTHNPTEKQSRDLYILSHARIS